MWKSCFCLWLRQWCQAEKLTKSWLQHEGWTVWIWMTSARRRFVGLVFSKVLLGAGKFQHANGDVFVGNWKSNAAHGVGQRAPQISGKRREIWRWLKGVKFAESLWEPWETQMKIDTVCYFTYLYISIPLYRYHRPEYILRLHSSLRPEELSTRYQIPELVTFNSIW